MATHQIILKSVEFEVFGRVQGVFFRKNTIEKAKALGLVGWVRNHCVRKSVQGCAQGQIEPLEELKEWLTKVGSPNSRISSCDFNNEKEISVLEFKDFTRYKTCST
ncbi:Acylphosphatase-1-like [Oopsacas minuta]|uniref:acylphosphatase n=1 Tax=Oopsacas minuta TaxID=111878 RepID=A0AAV7JMT6_9METZ|nr:Acylphosphatase-1-like [Oopsacas minuta]